MGRSRRKKQSALPLRAASRPLPAWLPAAVLVAVTLLAYLPALRAGFVWDDKVFLTDNPLIKAPDGLRLFWFSARPPDYFPLTSTVLWFEWRLWHMNPAGYHLVNILLHALSAVLVWRVLARLIPQGGTGAWLAGLIFAVHPVCVESVAWITELKNALSLPLFLAGLLLYLRFDETAEHPTGTPHSAICILNSAICNRLYVLSLFLFLLALLAKTSVVMLPPVLLLCAWWRRGRISRRDLLRAAPFFLLALALSAVTVWFQYHRAIGHDVVRTDTFLARAAGAGWAAWFYLYKALLPISLCCVYPRWTTSAALLSFLPALALLAAMVLFWLRRRCNSGRRVLRPDVDSLSSRSRGADGCRPADAGPQGTAADWGRPLFLGLGYFLLMLLPVAGFLNIYFMRYSLVADRWQYPALIGLVALAAAGAVSWAGGGKAAAPPSWKRPVLFYSCAVVAAALGALTWVQCHAWGDEETLWSDTVSVNPGAWIAWTNLGSVYSRKGLEKKAIPFFDKAIALNPDDADAYKGRASALTNLGRCDEALADCDRAVQLKPTDARAYMTRAATFARMGRYAESLADCSWAIHLRPDLAEPYVNRASALIHLGRYAEAVADCDTVIRWLPDEPDAYINRAAALNSLGRYAEALADCNQAIQLNPNDALAYIDRAEAEMELRLYPSALDDWSRAIRLQPGAAAAYENRALVRFALKDYAGAREDAAKCLSLGGRPDPNFLKDLSQAPGREK